MDLRYVAQQVETRQAWCEMAGSRRDDIDPARNRSSDGCELCGTEADGKMHTLIPKTAIKIDHNTVLIRVIRGGGHTKRKLTSPFNSQWLSMWDLKSTIGIFCSFLLDAHALERQPESPKRNSVLS